ncbi:MAG: DUF4258 domain-containing protein [Bacteroidales bacterium]
MNYKISGPAEEQMNKKNILKEIVDKILQQPEQIINEETYTIYQSIIDENGKSYLYRVFVNTKKAPSVVITVYKTSKTDKYYES